MRIERSLCVRLHPKPQIEVKYEKVEGLGLLQTAKVGLIITNLSLYTLSDFRYPAKRANLLHSTVSFLCNAAFRCSVVDRVVSELLPHVSHRVQCDCRSSGR